MKIAVAGGTGTVGSHVVAIARERGHEVVVISRANGVDLLTGSGLGPALADVETVVDVSSVQTQSDSASRDFFGTTTRTLLDAEVVAGVGHHVLLGIVGTDKAPVGYYAGKALQEDLVERGSVPWTIQRATQFHEFAGQIYGAATFGPIALTPRMTSQPIAAREVAETLVALATDSPAGRVTDLAGPRVESMPRLVRAWAKATGKRGAVIAIPLPGPFGAAMRDGSILPDPGATLGTQTFDEWLAALTPTSR